LEFAPREASYFLSYFCVYSVLKNVRRSAQPRARNEIIGGESVVSSHALLFHKGHQLFYERILFEIPEKEAEVAPASLLEADIIGA
jgi:hypothetical protein